MNDLNDILENVIDKNLKTCNILEIGTGEGKNSTVILNKFCKENFSSYKLISYEGEKSYYIRAKKFWNKNPNVTIINEYFSNKFDINDLVVKNIPDFIKDYNETGDRIKNKYIKLSNTNTNYFTNINFVPDIIFIDSSRFMHIAIINLCHQILKEKKDTLIIMEEDYFVNNQYGELDIIEKYFNLKNVIKYSKGSWQWPFVSFIIDSKK